VGGKVPPQPHPTPPLFLGVEVGVGWGTGAVLKWGVFVGEVVSIFRAERWVEQWESLDGGLYLGGGPIEADGAVVPALLEMAPLTADQAVRRRMKLMRDQLAAPGARASVIDFLARREATRGW